MGTSTAGKLQPSPPELRSWGTQGAWQPPGPPKGMAVGAAAAAPCESTPGPGGKGQAPTALPSALCPGSLGADTCSPMNGESGCSLCHAAGMAGC